MATVTNPAISFIGSGTVGQVVDWSVSEEATPVSISDTSGSVPSMSFNASATDDSVYLNDCLATFTHGARSFDGRVMRASIRGAAASVDVESGLRVLNASRVAPPVGRWALPTVAVGSYGMGDGQFRYPGDVAFDASGSMFVADRGNFRIQKFSPDGNGGWTFVAKVGTPGSGDGQFGGPSAHYLLNETSLSAANVGWLAIDSAGNVYVTDPYNRRIQKFTNSLAFSSKVDLVYVPTGITIDASDVLYVANVGGMSVTKYTTALSPISTFSVGHQVTGLAYNPVTSKIAACLFQASSTIVNSVRNFTTAGASTGETTPIGLSAEDGYFGADPATPGIGQTPYDVTCLPNGLVAAVDVYNGRVQLFTSSLEFVGAVGSFGSGAGQFTNPRGIGCDSAGNIYVADHGNHRVQVFSGTTATCTVPLSSAISQYVALADSSGSITVSYDAAADPDVAFPGWQDSVWSKLKQLCAAYGLEMRFVNGVLHFDDVGTRELDVSNRTVATLSPASVQVARSIGVVNHNVISRNGVTLYDAAASGALYEVAVGGRIVTTISTSNAPAIVGSPSPVSTAPIGSGQYMIQDSTGATVSAPDWTAAGGSVSAYIGSSPGSINLTIIGPDADVPGFTGPYALAYTTGGVKVPALTIAGAGIVTDPKVVVVPTGANPDAIASESLRVVDIPFIGDEERAWDAGVRASVEFLFGQTLSFTIPPDESVQFGDYVGRKFTHKGARYRVIAATHSASGVEITAAWHTTVGELDTTWGSQTVGNFDAKWGTRPARDVATTPLLTT